MINPALPWTYNLEEAIHLQESLRQRLVLSWDNRPVNVLAGVDFSYTASSTIRASIAMFSYPDLAHQQAVVGEAPQTFPYISGLLAYRVGPAILAAWEKLKYKPDVLLIHGHGVAHPRGVGLASHIGLWINTPTIGVAKTRLYGQQTEIGSNVGDWSDLFDENDPNNIIGAVLRTRGECKPIYVSAGHLIDLPHAIEFVLASCRGCRMPEPLRLAHHAAVVYQTAKIKNLSLQHDTRI
jgi:deoxyribonuclease V